MESSISHPSAEASIGDSQDVHKLKQRIADLERQLAESSKSQPPSKVKSYNSLTLFSHSLFSLSPFIYST